LAIAVPRLENRAVSSELHTPENQQSIENNVPKSRALYKCETIDVVVDAHLGFRQVDQVGLLLGDFVRRPFDHVLAAVLVLEHDQLVRAARVLAGRTSVFARMGHHHGDCSRGGANRYARVSGLSLDDSPTDNARRMEKRRRQQQQQNRYYQLRSTAVGIVLVGAAPHHWIGAPIAATGVR